MMDFTQYKALLAADRSVRRFCQAKTIDHSILRELVGLATLCASGRNLQPLKYRLVSTPEECEAVFPLLAWAGYLTDWPGPEEGERPAAYLVQCLDTDMTTNCLCDDGIQLQAITLGARSLGIGACIIKAFNAAKISETLDLPANLKPLYVLALGFPAETIKLEPLSQEGDYKYYRSADGFHHVPKRSVDDIII